MTDTSTPPPGQDADLRPPIDADWLARMRTKPDFLNRLFEVFLEEEPRRIKALGKAVAGVDLDQVRHLAHALKGAAATMGMERLRDACRELEFAAKGGEAESLRRCFEKIRLEMEAVYAEMRKYSETA